MTSLTNSARQTGLDAPSAHSLGCCSSGANRLRSLPVGFPPRCRRRSHDSGVAPCGWRATTCARVEESIVQSVSVAAVVSDTKGPRRSAPQTTTRKESDNAFAEALKSLREVEQNRAAARQRLRELREQKCALEIRERRDHSAPGGACEERRFGCRRDLLLPRLQRTLRVAAGAYGLKRSGWSRRPGALYWLHAVDQYI